MNNDYIAILIATVLARIKMVVIKNTVTDEGSTATHSKAMWIGLDWILLRKLVRLKHLAVLIIIII